MKASDFDKGLEDTFNKHVVLNPLDLKIGQFASRAWIKGLWHSESDFASSLKELIEGILEDCENERWHAPCPSCKDGHTSEDVLERLKNL